MKICNGWISFARMIDSGNSMCWLLRGLKVCICSRMRRDCVFKKYEDQSILKISYTLFEHYKYHNQDLHYWKFGFYRGNNVVGKKCKFRCWKYIPSIIVFRWYKYRRRRPTDGNTIIYFVGKSSIFADEISVGKISNSIDQKCFLLFHR